MPTNLEKTIKGITTENLSENLLEQVPIEKTLRPKGFYKTIGLDALSVLSAIWVGYACGDFLQNGAVLNFAISVFPFLILNSFETILIKSLGRRFLVIAAETVIFLLFFYRDPQIYLFAAGGAFLAFSLWGEIMSRSLVSTSLEVNFLKFTAPFFKKTITGLILFTIIIFVPNWNKNNVFISPAAFGGVFVWSSGIAQNFYPELNFNSTVNDLARNITSYQLSSSAYYKTLPGAVQKSVFDQTLPQISDRLKQVLGGNLSGDEKISDVLYKIILNSLNSWRADYGAWFIFAWIAVVFLASRTIGAFVWWLSALISWLIYQFLVALNFVAIRGETVTKEALAFP
ncbi:MAG TPA: hypothetical protein VMV71_04400 [Candidatus Paceibacterota bacterium]|nr:hypothetical protein [Candidatus Paceibacterota bacterium]